MDRLTTFVTAKDRTRLDALLAVLDFNGGGPLRVSKIVEAAANAGLRQAANWNVSQVLARSSHLAVLLPSGWKLTSSGSAQLASLGWQSMDSERQNLIDDLAIAAAAVASDDRRAFIEEAIECYKNGLNRSAVVLSWSGAVAVLHDYVLAKKLAEFNAEAIRVGVTKKAFANAADFQELRDAKFLELLVPIGVLDKNEKQELDARRQLRNGCGHPSKLKVGNRMVSAHLESLITHVFQKF